LRKIQAKTGEWRTPPCAPGKTAVVEPSLAAAVEPDPESVNCFNRGSVSLVSLRRRRELRVETLSSTIPAEAPQFRPAGTGVASSCLYIESGDAKPHFEPHAFPEASTAPTLPARMREEILDFYAFIFRQRGFCGLGMTFEQFLLVVAAVKPEILHEIQE